MKTIVYLGIDPGWSGAVAVLEDVKMDVHKCPSEAAGISKLVDGFALIRPDVSTYAMFEEVHGRGFGSYGAVKWSAQSTFRFGENVGIWKGLLESYGIRYHCMIPQKWQPLMLGKFPKGMSKEISLERAKNRYPHLAKKVGRNHNFADAIHLAELCKMYFSNFKKHILEV